MKNRIDELIEIAVDRHGDITPCGKHTTLHDSITIEDGVIHFWYNCDIGSTHLIIEN